MARLTDELTGERFDVSARVVINATGVWAAEVDPSIKLRPSRGTHLVFDAAALGNPAEAADKATATVDNAHARYFIIHAHKLLDPSVG